MKNTPLIWVIVFVVVAAVVAGVSLTRNGLPGVSPRPESVAERDGFGKLPAFDIATGDARSMAALGTPEAISARPSAVWSSAAAGTPVATGDVAVSNTGATMVLQNPNVASTMMIAPGEPTRPVPMPPEEEYLPPKVEYVWEGSTLPSVPEEMAVFRTTPRPLSAVGQQLLKALGMNTALAGAVQSVSFRSTRDPRTMLTYDATSDMLSWYRDMDWSEPQLEAATVPDAEAIRMAEQFLRDLGLDPARYGAARVVRFTDPCGRGMPCIMESTPPGVSGGGSAGSAGTGSVSANTVTSAPTPVSSDSKMMIYPYPGNDVTVQWDGTLGGQPLLDWNGQPQATVSVQISSQTRQVQSGQIRFLTSLAQSKYRTQSVDAIRTAALKGGSSPWGGWYEPLTANQERRRPTVTVHLTSATLGYMEKQNYTPEKQEHYFVPVVVFTGTVTDQYGNTYPHTVLVPALDPSVFADEQPQPIPVPMMKAVPPSAIDMPAPAPLPISEPAVAPTR